nr:VWA domain-containing protein [uncultured Devosia sp.]
MRDADIESEFLRSIAAVEKAAGKSAARQLEMALPRARAVLAHDALTTWLQTLIDLSVGAPDAFAVVAMRGDDFLTEIDARAFRRWVMDGIAIPEGKGGARLAHFGATDSGALQAMALLRGGDAELESLTRPLSATALALWNVQPIIRPISPAKARRASFSGRMVRMPTRFAGFDAGHADQLFQAAVSHIGAHHAHTLALLQPAALKPIQIAIISLLEDSRVELLAGMRYPGLLRLWRSFHAAQPTGANLSEPLLARLARALIDPTYSDDNSWVVKGRSLFANALNQNDPAALRRIGVLLGNDLGQMRIQFNAKTYTVQPAYRDDNLGIWAFDTPPESERQEDLVFDAVRVEQREDRGEQRKRKESDDAETGTARMTPPDPDTGIAVARYGEWDYLAGRMQSDWTTLVEYSPQPSRPEIIDYLLSGYSDIQRRVSSLVTQARIGRSTRRKRQPEGDRLDLDATIRAAIDRRSGHIPDTRIYEHSARRQRDLSVLLLLDVSESTKDTIRGTAASIFSVERVAVALLAEAMASLEDPFALHAFASNTRSDVRFLRIKDFDEPYGRSAKARLAGLKPGYSTRMGAILRHGAREISSQQTHRRLVLIVSDGEPSDVDVKDPRYLTEDARRAVQELARAGIDVFCVALASGDSPYLERVFGRNVLRISTVESLPERLPSLYFKLTA